MAKKKTSKAVPKKGKRETNRKKTKAKILKVALELFRKKGFYKTTTKEISQKAKIAEGTLFNYFKTKEDLALYFFETETQSCIDWFYEDAYIQSAPLPEKLFGIIERNLDRLAPYEEFIGAVYLRSLQPNSKLSPLSLDVHSLRVKQLTFIRDILEDATEREEIPPIGDLGVYAVGLGYIGVMTYWLHDQSEGKEDTAAFLDRVLTLAHRLIQQNNWDW